MPGLGYTTAMLAGLRRRSAEAGGSDESSDGRLVTHSFNPNPGRLRMLSYAPAAFKAGAPLVVVLHGCTQSAAAYASGAGWMTLAQRHGFVVLAPEQLAENNANRCFNWFQPGDITRGQGEAASIRAMVAQAVAIYGCDPARVFVTGLSAGGAMTSVMLATYPEVFAGGAIIAGLPYGIARTVQEAIAAMYADQDRTPQALAKLVREAAPALARRPRISIWHGDADHTVRPGNAIHSTQQWLQMYGLTAQPSVESVGAWTRSTWLSAAGEPLVEANVIQGLGHGTPLASGGPEGLGAAGPFLLEAGVSSTLQIARFWNLVPKSRPEEARPAESAQARRNGSTLGDQVMAAVSRHVPQEVRDTIAKALRAAGIGP